VSVPPAPQEGEEHRPRFSLGQFVVGILVVIGVLWLLIPTGGPHEDFLSEFPYLGPPHEDRTVA
jgi:hypothetical protein